MDSSAPLSMLYISPLNARKTGREVDLEEMADSLAAHGVIDRLHVIDEGREGGMLGLIDGGRRFLALQLLDARGWPTDKIDREAIPITFDPPEEAREISLATFTHKVPINAADEVVAYAGILAQYEANGEPDPDVRIARCAHHFGKTIRYVEQRLRLAGLAPEILEALRVGRISLDAASAYASVADHKIQLEVFAAQERQGGHRVAAIRSALAGRFYRVGDSQVRFVGLDAYCAAGGRVDRDLFMGQADDEIVLDTVLLDRLAVEKAEGEGRRLAAEAGFAGAALKSWGASSLLWPETPDGYQRAYTLAPLTLEERSTAIAVCAIARDGSGLELTDEGFRPLPADANQQPPAPPPSRGPLPAFLAPPPGESEVERLARIRRQMIERTALRLALPSLEGTGLDGRTFYPPEGARTIEALQEDEETYAVAIYVTVPKADVARRMAEAEAEVDGELGGSVRKSAGPPWPPAADAGEEWPDEAPAAREPAEAGA